MEILHVHEVNGVQQILMSSYEVSVIRTSHEIMTLSRSFGMLNPVLYAPCPYMHTMMSMRFICKIHCNTDAHASTKKILFHWIAIHTDQSTVTDSIALMAIVAGHNQQIFGNFLQLLLTAFMSILVPPWSAGYLMQYPRIISTIHS